MFSNLLKNGKKIRVYDKNGKFTATTFYYKDGIIYYNNDELGYNCKHDLFTEKHGKFNRHIVNMLNDGFCIDIQ
jgi:hypothetical protein